MTINDITPEQIKQVDGFLSTILTNMGMFRINVILIVEMMNDIGGLENETEQYGAFISKFEEKGLSMELEDKLLFLDLHSFLIDIYKEYVVNQ